MLYPFNAKRLQVNASIVASECLNLHLALNCLHFLMDHFTLTTPETKLHLISSTIKSNVNRTFLMMEQNFIPVKFHFWSHRNTILYFPYQLLPVDVFWVTSTGIFQISHYLTAFLSRSKIIFMPCSSFLKHIPSKNL